MSAAIGSIIGLILAAFVGALIGAFCGVLGGQLASIRNFWGDKRGQFEYEYCESHTLRKAKKILIKAIGWFSCQRLYLSELGEISWSEGEQYKDIIKKINVEDEDKYYIYIRAGYVLKTKRKYENSIVKLEKAIEIHPATLVPTFMIAQSFERLGEAEKAILAYKTALEDSYCKSNNIREYLNDQIQRVQIKGPSKKSPMSGLRHLGMGR
jgi:tetratricopeptide (TPR) repeat protein